MSLRAGSLRRALIRPLGLALAIVVPVVVATASADTQVVNDGRNTSANLFDISRATAGHNGSLLQHTVRTYRTWKSKELVSTDDEPRDICIYIWRAKSDPEEQQDYQVCAHFEDGKLKASVFHVRPPHRRTGSVRVLRHDQHSITYTFAKRAIGNPQRYQWQAVTGFTGKSCPRDPPFQFGCDDSAPTGGVRIHRLTGRPQPGDRHER
jgi:hypothetical protein